MEESAGGSAKEIRSPITTYALCSNKKVALTVAIGVKHARHGFGKPAAAFSCRQIERVKEGTRSSAVKVRSAWASEEPRALSHSSNEEIGHLVSIGIGNSCHREAEVTAEPLTRRDECVKEILCPRR